MTKLGTTPGMETHMLNLILALLAPTVTNDKSILAKTVRDENGDAPVDVTDRDESGDAPVDVTEQAGQHRGFKDIKQPLLVSRDAYDTLVAWSPEDSERHDADLDQDVRLDSLLAQASGAMQRVRGGFQHALFLVEHYSKCKRGNPRRARVLLRDTPSGLLIDLAA